MKVLDEYIKSIIRTINTSKNQDINMYKLKVSGSKKEKRTIEWIKNKFVTNKTMQNTIVTDDVQRLYYDDITKFINSKEYYFKKGIPYKRGYLLHGEPGCGKTSLIKAVAHDLNLPIFMVDLSVLSDNTELMTAMNELNYHINDNEPYLLIFEDFDRTSLFGKTNRYGEYEEVPKSKITQDCILNILDGIDESHGRIVIITTNDLDKIRKFKSLIRPGRIDVLIGVTYCKVNQLKKIIQFYFDIEDIEKYKLNNNIVITPAQLLQIMYLVNDIDKTVLLLNKIIDFVNIDIEKEIFNIKFVEQIPTEDKPDNFEIVMDNIKIKVPRGTKSRPSRSRGNTRQKRQELRKKRALDKIDITINKSKASISQIEASFDKINDIKKLDLEAKKIKLKMAELRKEKMIAMSESLKKPVKNPSKKKAEIVAEFHENLNNIIEEQVVENNDLNIQESDLNHIINNEDNSETQIETEIKTEIVV
jgi:SpoVK/Ycf46/Vps4 family AAA+-type ATPase